MDKLKKYLGIDLKTSQGFEHKGVPALILFVVLITIGIVVFVLWRGTFKEDEENTKVVVTVPILAEFVNHLIKDEKSIDLIILRDSENNKNLTEEEKEIIRNADIVLRMGEKIDGWFDFDEDDINIIDLSSGLDLYLKNKSVVNDLDQFPQACNQNQGVWLSGFNECENISKEICTSFNGSFNECASSCRHEVEDICTTDCVKVCIFPKDLFRKEETEVLDYTYYLDPENMRVVNNKIYFSLSSIRGDLSSAFFNNAKEYDTSLSELTESMRSKVSKLENYKILTYDNFLTIFENRLGLKIDFYLEDVWSESLSDKLNNYFIDNNINIVFYSNQIENDLFINALKDQDINLKNIDIKNIIYSEDNYIDNLNAILNSIINHEK